MKNFITTLYIPAGAPFFTGSLGLIFFCRNSNHAASPPGNCASRSTDEYIFDKVSVDDLISITVCDIQIVEINTELMQKNIVFFMKVILGCGKYH